MRKTLLMGDVLRGFQVVLRIIITSTGQNHHMHSRDRLGARVQRAKQDRGHAKQGCRNAKLAEARYL